MTPGEAVLRIQGLLEAEGLEESRLQAEALVMHLLDMDRARLYTRWQKDLVPADLWRRLQALAHRRLQREPLPYILGHREFFGLDFLVDRRVLIPRPETEALVEQALAIATQISPQGDVTVADVGTGCGAIAVTLAHHLPRATVWATDSSASALEVASENARRHSVAHRLHLLQGDLLHPLPHPVDLVVSNPPYVPSDLLPLLDPELHCEPQEALDGGRHGTQVIQRLLEQAPSRLTLRGALLVEVSPTQANALAERARRLFPPAQVQVIPDLAGRARVVAVRRAASPEPGDGSAGAVANGATV